MTTKQNAIDIQDLNDRLILHMKSDEDQHEKHRLALECIMKEQKRNYELVQKLAEETREILKLHADLKSVFRISVAVQKFLLWLAKWGIIATAAKIALTWIVKTFK